MPPTKHNAVQVALHWITAAMIVFLLAMGHFVLEELPNSDPMKMVGLRGHMVVGGGALALMIVRIFWRAFTPQPPHAQTGNALMDKAGVAAHFALYAVAILVGVSGVGLAKMSGLPDIVFGGQGTLPENFFGYPPRFAHGVLTKVLAALIVLHVLAALYHQFVLKDGLFRRMWFGNTEG